MAQQFGHGAVEPSAVEEVFQTAPSQSSPCRAQSFYSSESVLTRLALVETLTRNLQVHMRVPVYSDACIQTRFDPLNVETLPTFVNAPIEVCIFLDMATSFCFIQKSHLYVFGKSIFQFLSVDQLGILGLKIRIDCISQEQLRSKRQWRVGSKDRITLNYRLGNNQHTHQESSRQLN